MKHVNKRILIIMVACGFTLITFAENINAGDKPKFVPNYCQHLWNEQSLDFSRIAIEMRYKELKKNPPTNANEKMQKFFLWSIVEDAIAENLSTQVTKASWLREVFEQQMESESLHPSNLNTPLLERVENQIRLDAAPTNKQSPFSSMADFNSFLNAYYKTGWMTNHDKLSSVLTTLQQLKRWNLGRLQYTKTLIDKLITEEKSEIHENLQYEVMNQISNSLMQSRDRTRQSSLIELDVLSFTTLGFMPASYLDSEINQRIRVRLIHHEFEILEAHATDRSLPKGFREEILAHLYFLRLHSLSLDPTGHLVNSNLKTLKHP